MSIYKIIDSVDSTNFNYEIDFNKEQIKESVQKKIFELFDNITPKVIDDSYHTSAQQKNEMLRMLSQEFQKKSSELVDTISSQFQFVLQSQKKNENSLISQTQDHPTRIETNSLKRKRGKEEKENNYPNKIRKIRTEIIDTEKEIQIPTFISRPSQQALNIHSLVPQYMNNVSFQYQEVEKERQHSNLSIYEENLTKEPENNSKKRTVIICDLNEENKNIVLPGQIGKINHPYLVNLILQSIEEKKAQEHSNLKQDQGKISIQDPDIYLKDHLNYSLSSDNPSYRCAPTDIINLLINLPNEDLNHKQKLFEQWKINFANLSTQYKGLTISRIHQDEKERVNRAKQKDKIVEEGVLFCLEETFMKTMDSILNKKTTTNTVPMYLEHVCTLLLNTPNLKSIVSKWFACSLQSRIYQSIKIFLATDPTQFKHKNKEKTPFWFATSTLYTYLFYESKIATQSFLKPQNILSQGIPIDNLVTLVTFEELQKSQKEEHAKWFELIQSKRSQLMNLIENKNKLNNLGDII